MICLEVSDLELKDAIEIRMSDVFPAMNIANAMGGLQARTRVWQIIRSYSLLDLVVEALDRGLNVSEFRDHVCDKAFSDCKIYQDLKDKVEERSDFSN